MSSLPGVYRQCAVAYTDFWESYKTVIPSKRHRAVGKETGQTNPIERLNNTFRQRISRLVRESLSFSKKMENHVGEPFGILSMRLSQVWWVKCILRYIPLSEGVERTTKTQRTQGKIE